MEPALKLEITPHEELRDGLQPETAFCNKSWLCQAHLPTDNQVTSHFQQIRNNAGFGGLGFFEVVVVFFFGVIKHLFTSWCLLQRQAFGDLQLEKGQKKGY